MSTTTLSQRLRELRDMLMSEESDTPNVMNLVDDCIAQAEAMEGQPIGAQKPVAWMKRDTTSDMLPESALELVMERDAAAYIRKTWMPLYGSPISPEARDRAINALDKVQILLNMNANSNEFYDRRAKVRPLVNDALSALRGE